MFKPKGSLASRNALVYFVLFLVGIGVTGLALFSYSSREIIDLTEKRLTHTAEMIRLKLMDHTDNLEKDINQLAGSPLLSRYSADTSQANLNILTQEYISVLKSKPNFFQIRLIEVNELGREIIRVERKNDILMETPTAELQYKGDRDYFIELSNMPLDSLYYSDINLNREHTKISEPRTPTLRMGKRLEANKFGEVILIVNIDLNNIFNELEQLLPESYELRILNKDLHYLIHPNQVSTFTFEYNQPSFFSEEFEEDIYLDEKGEWKNEFQTEKSMVSCVDIPYGRRNRSLRGMVTADKSIILSSFYTWRNKVLFLILGVAFVFLLLAFFYMRRQSKELNSITAQLSSFANDPTPMELTIKRNDEIGELASSFELMSKKISESQQLLEHAREKAEEAYAEKNKFLENMSHEIRNPLQTIIGTAEILEQNKLNPSQQPFINSLKFSATQLKSLVTDILDYGKIKAGQIEINPTWNRLDIFCEELIQSLGHIAQRKSIDLKFESDPALIGKHFYFDSVRLYQILNNLLNNALKFTAEKGQVSLTIMGEDKDMVQFAVNDNGAGMPKKELSRILERNYTSDYSSGAGLGLTIVKELLKIQHSEINVHSEKGEGSSFTFELQMAVKGKEEELIVDKEMSDQQNFAGLSLLIVEDDEELKNWYAHLFKSSDLTIVNGPNEIPSDKQWQVIITDLNFENSRIELREYIPQLLPKVNIDGSIIIVSGNDASQFQESKLALCFYAKPVNRQVLLDRVRRSMKGIEFGMPDCEQISKDYDYESSLIQNAMRILLEEWEKDKQRYREAILNKNIEDFDAISHKILATVRRFKLDKYSHLLETIREKMLDDQEDLEFWQEKLNNSMEFIASEMNTFRLDLKNNR